MPMFERRLKRGIVSKPLLDRPTLSPYHQKIWEAFHMLSITRPMGGFGVSGIPYQNMRDYLDENDIIDKTIRELYIECFLIMDSVFMAHYNSPKEEYKDGY